MLLRMWGGTFDTEYLLPESLTRDKDTITVKFQSVPGSLGVGGLLDVRTVWADLQE